MSNMALDLERRGLLIARQRMAFFEANDRQEALFGVDRKNRVQVIGDTNAPELHVRPGHRELLASREVTSAKAINRLL